MFTFLVYLICELVKFRLLLIKIKRLVSLLPLYIISTNVLLRVCLHIVSHKVTVRVNVKHIYLLWRKTELKCDRKEKIRCKFTLFNPNTVYSYFVHIFEQANSLVFYKLLHDICCLHTITVQKG